MMAQKFYFPSNGEDQDALIEHTWNQGVMSYLLFVRRMSHRGNPYIKGVFILDDDDATVPSEFECTLLSNDYASLLVSEFQEELSMENNGVKSGSLPQQIKIRN